MDNSKTAFRPILFSTPMVQAILENRKRMTRRSKGLEAINMNQDLWIHKGITTLAHSPSKKNDFKIFQSFENSQTGETLLILNPYEIGDVLWVRENFYTASNWDHWKPSMLKSVNVEVFYQADMKYDTIPKPLHRGKMRPNIFLPKEYARIFLKIKSIKAERLQDISEIDAINEGVLFNKLEHSTKTLPSFFYNYLSKELKELTSKLSFESLWISINKQKSWSQNPFVFVYEFEQIEKPLDFI